ncbi:hypothetical protein MFLAVUS_007751 [Mucor flavus]|uniref:N-acetyltransferase domain-containing protein n=1 Tax=Mucor flavus TaxID=439312 RepID=A0ABP9Z5C0_9FUNG
MTSYANINIIHLTEPGQVELAYSVRYKVYVCEQGYATNTVTDEEDEHCQHWAAVADKTNVDGTIENGVPIGTIRLAIKPDNVARLGRVAVISSARGLKVGPKLIDIFERYCIEQGYHTIYLHAVSEKRGFYERLGFVVEQGDHEEFSEDGTPHIRLWKRNLI